MDRRPKVSGRGGEEHEGEGRHLRQEMEVKDFSEQIFHGWDVGNEEGAGQIRGRVDTGRIRTIDI